MVLRKNYLNLAIIQHSDAIYGTIVILFAIFSVVEVLRNGHNPETIKTVQALKGCSINTDTPIMNPSPVKLDPLATLTGGCMVDVSVPVSSPDSGVLMHQKTSTTPGAVGPEEARVFLTTFEKNLSLAQNTRLPYKSATIADVVHHINGYIINYKKHDTTVKAIHFMSKDLVLGAIHETNRTFFSRIAESSQTTSQFYTNFSEGLCRGYIYAYKEHIRK